MSRLALRLSTISVLFSRRPRGSFWRGGAKELTVDYADLIAALPPPPNRLLKCDGLLEHHLFEGAVMVSFAMHLMRTHPVNSVSIHPDGEHGKQFDFRGWLGLRGYDLEVPAGSTAYGGTYRAKDGRSVIVDPRSGVGDVVAELEGAVFTAECKGGIINTRHPGQVSRLYKGLCETVGMLMASPSRGRQFAVVPLTDGTLRLAKRLAPRCALAGIEIALVGDRGQVIDVTAGD
jgi:hypothetical protein